MLSSSILRERSAALVQRPHKSRCLGFQPVTAPLVLQAADHETPVLSEAGDGNLALAEASRFLKLSKSDVVADHPWMRYVRLVPGPNAPSCCIMPSVSIRIRLSAILPHQVINHHAFDCDRPSRVNPTYRQKRLTRISFRGETSTPLQVLAQPTQSIPLRILSTPVAWACQRTARRMLERTMKT